MPAQWFDAAASRSETLLLTHAGSGIGMTALADQMGCPASCMSRPAKRAEAALEAKRSA